MSLSSHALIERALRRIQKLGDGEERQTSDPLLAEIALAQVDATLAVARVLEESASPHHTMLRELHDENQSLRRYIDGLTQEVSRLRRSQAPTPRRWWHRFGL